jgi:predicted RNA-binding Zn ribbon-like protein
MGYGVRFGWIDFVNSEYWDGFGVPTDYLGDSAWCTAFLADRGLRVDAQATFPLATFKGLRANLRLAAEELARGGNVPLALMRRFNVTLSKAVFRTIEGKRGTYQIALHPARQDWQWIGAQIVASFGTFLESDQTHRLKTCPNPGCRWLFYDETKGNTRRWCNDRLCGNRDKVRRHRAKNRESASAR